VRLMSLLAVRDGSSTISRINVWMDVLQMFRTAPWLGHRRGTTPSTLSSTPLPKQPKFNALTPYSFPWNGVEEGLRCSPDAFWSSVARAEPAQPGLAPAAIGGPGGHRRPRCSASRHDVFGRKVQLTVALWPPCGRPAPSDDATTEKRTIRRFLLLLLMPAVTTTTLPTWPPAPAMDACSTWPRAEVGGSASARAAGRSCFGWRWTNQLGQARAGNAADLASAGVRGQRISGTASKEQGMAWQAPRGLLPMPCPGFCVTAMSARPARGPWRLRATARSW